ncbi:hypothetical protein CC1G_05572 [Coprinopsis cinerea okayama7|uniref:Uncharacterized protein n=1 Tax=Coprinopsis cinerea (strain Okayama-7 / 130 / ATCC MYA-4618 / FGSC 9003) TaxID=240176 RepID=A8P1G6_COPC7|nr:hypothetical protein CC1G_05572 [Coprinopsis cinerea okayama7\|eukprot:XP_001838091.1 hypothetical protein CC1G_05572 [Coprinopsis cinerea okayama7\
MPKPHFTTESEAVYKRIQRRKRHRPKGTSRMLEWWPHTVDDPDKYHYNRAMAFRENVHPPPTKPKKRTSAIPCLHNGTEDFDEQEFFESLEESPSKREKTVDEVPLTDLPIRFSKPKGAHVYDVSFKGTVLMHGLVTGIKRDYEFVDKVQDVLVLDDEVLSVLSEEDWEEIFAEIEESDSTRRSLYATVAGEQGKQRWRSLGNANSDKADKAYQERRSLELDVCRGQRAPALTAEQ